MRIPSTKRQPSSDWVLQFINIVFLILLFFMVNGTIASAPRPDIDPPIAVFSEASNPPQNAVYIDRNGRMSFNGQSLNMVELERVLTEPVAGGAAPSAIVADRRLAAATLVALLSDLQAKGIAVLPLITLKEQR
jgi:biopolymer transport protein ExbD